MLITEAKGEVAHVSGLISFGQCAQALDKCL